MKKYLSEKEYEKFLATYPAAKIEFIWDSVFVMCDLFQSTAVELSQTLNFAYDYDMAENSLRFLQHIKELPSDAQEIYP